MGNFRFEPSLGRYKTILFSNPDESHLTVTPGGSSLVCLNMSSCMLPVMSTFFPLAVRLRRFVAPRFSFPRLCICPVVSLYHMELMRNVFLYAFQKCQQGFDVCCCLPTPMTLVSGGGGAGESDVPACGPPPSFSIHLASSAGTSVTVECCFVPVLRGCVWYVCGYVRKKALLQCLSNY